MTCTCIETVNEKLKERNTRLEIPIMLRFKGEPRQDDRVIIRTEQVETGRGKAKAVAMFPTYCPFCGVVHDG
jgi:predicted Zn-ribbon and HTH transcriptional regulator